MMNGEFRSGTLVDPVERISPEQVGIIHKASMAILDNPGILCFSDQAAGILDKAGCLTTKELFDGKTVRRVRFPESAIMGAVESIPAKVILGARNPKNRLLLDANVPRVYFGTGSETNIVLKTEMAQFVKADDPETKIMHPLFTRERGNVARLCESAKLCDALPNVDFFIRNVNVQDPDITTGNKDVNVFLASLAYMTKHVQAGLANLACLDDILRLGEIVAGGPEAFRKNPILSFITCLVKSPLQMVEDTTDKLIAMARKGVPVVVSSSPQGGSTAPIREEGIVAMINAEILAGMTLAQLVNPGTPVLYGAVPVRARLDNLNDLYGAPEFIHYNMDCVQLARLYGVPCYSTAGVGDGSVPGMQTLAEKFFSYLALASTGAQYIHYAVGLLEKTNVFSPLQAVLDDAHIGIVREILRKPGFGENEAANAVKEVRKVMDSSSRLFARYIRKAMREGKVSAPYPFESADGGDEVMKNAHGRLAEIMRSRGERLSDEVWDNIAGSLPTALPRERFHQ